MNKLVFISFLILTGSFVSAQTLEEYLVIALEQNPELDAREATWQAALLDAEIVSGLPDPVIGLGVFVLPVETRVGPQILKSSIMQRLPWFGTLGAREDGALLGAEAYREDLRSAQRNISYQVSDRWYQLFQIRQHSKLVNENLTILNSLNALAQTRYEAGKSTLVDVIRVRLMVKNSETQLANLQLRFESGQTAFNSILSRDLNVLVVVPDSISMPDSSALYTIPDPANHPALLAWDRRGESYEKQAEVARLEGLPTIGLGLEYAWVGQRKDAEVPQNGQDIFAPVVSLSLPLARGKYKAKRSQAEFRQTAALDHREALLLEYSSELATIQLQIEQQNNLLDLYKAQLREMHSALKILLTAYTSGEEGFEEVLRMQQEVINLEIKAVDAEVTIFRAWAKIEFLTGYKP